MGYKINLPYGSITLEIDTTNRRIIPQIDCSDIRYFITITKEINRLNQIIYTIRDMKEYSTEQFIHIVFTIMGVLYNIE